MTQSQDTCSRARTISAEGGSADAHDARVAASDARLRRRPFRNEPYDPPLVVTVRNAREPLIEAAGPVTEMPMIEHPFRAGAKARAGIGF